MKRRSFLKTVGGSALFAAGSSIMPLSAEQTDDAKSGANPAANAATPGQTVMPRAQTSDSGGT